MIGACNVDLHVHVCACGYTHCGCMVNGSGSCLSVSSCLYIGAWEQSTLIASLGGAPGQSFRPLTGLWKRTLSRSALWRVGLPGTYTERGDSE